MLSVATAQAVLVRFCMLKSDILGSADDEIAASKGERAMQSLAKAQEELAKP